MDIGLREWLIIGGVLVIGLIIFDGWRRMRGQRDTLKIDIDGKFTEGAEVSEDGHHNPELPNGGARIKQHENYGAPYSQEPTSHYETQEPAAAPKAYARETSHARVVEETRPVDLGISAHQDSPLPVPVEYVLDESETDVQDERVINTKPSETPAPTYEEPAANEPVSVQSIAQESSFTAPANTVEFEQDYKSDDEYHELDPLFDEIPEIVSRPRSVSAASSHRLAVETTPTSNDITDPEFAQAIKGNSRSDDYARYEPQTIETSAPDQVPTSDIVHQNVKDPIVAAAIDASDTGEALDIDPLTIEKHDANAYASYEVHKAEDEDGVGGNVKLSVGPDSVPDPEIDFEQPVTVLMRQFTAEREEARIQQEMFDIPTAVEEAKEKVTLSETVNDTTVGKLAAKAQAVASVINAAKKRKPQPQQPEIQAPEAYTSEPEIEIEAPVASKVQPKDEPPEQDSLFADPLIEGAHTDRKAREHPPEPGEVLVITVVGKENPLNGKDLLKLVLACEMRHGDMDLFHRFEDGIDKGAVQFSMANAVNPGTFQLETMSDMETRGVSFFMSMSEPEDPKNAFECMLATAETVARHLDGDLLDENHSVMGSQTKMHYRERIREHEMHKRIRGGR